MDKKQGATTRKNDSDFDHLKVWQDNPDLNYYLSKDHWNNHVNWLLYNYLKSCHGLDTEFGLYLDLVLVYDIPPGKDYSPLYGAMLNESYRLCSLVIVQNVPETMVPGLLSQAMICQAAKMYPRCNAGTIIAYHILVITTFIFCFAKKHSDKVGKFLHSISLYDDVGVLFDDKCSSFEELIHKSIENDKSLIKRFSQYMKQGLKIVAGILFDGQIKPPGRLCPGYDYKGRDVYLRNTIPYYRLLAEECESRIPLQLNGSANTERAQKYFRKAIKKGWIIQKQKGKFDWGAFKTPKRGANDTAWAYFIAKVYEFDYNGNNINTNQLPRKYLEDLFSMPSGTLGAAFTRIKAGKNMKWKIEIDLFFEE